MLNALFKSIIDQDRAPVVVCDLEHIIVYMNPAAAEHYGASGGMGLVGGSIFSCHSEMANNAIRKIVAWFEENSENNMIYTYRNDTENKDVYMVALRNGLGELIGYYEKHEYRNRETAKLYDFSKSII